MAVVDEPAIPTAPQRRRRAPAIPKELRKEVMEIARALSRKYRRDFARDRKLKDRVLTLLRATLPPRPRRPGHPPNTETTKAITLYDQFQRQHPEAKPAELWGMVASELYPEYANLSAIAQQDIRNGLSERARARRRKRPTNSSRRKSR
jgi:hypothetical protein